MKRLLTTVAWLTFGLAAPAVAQTAPALPDADPAMWVVKDKDTTVYLFGTFHALDGKTAWFNDEVKAAFDASQEVVLEALMPDDMSKLQPLVVKYGVDPAGKTLSSKLSPEVKTKLGTALAGLGVPPQGLAAMEPLEPWMVNMTLAALAGAKIGLKPDSGADKQILASAKTAGKKLGELEGAEFQLAMLDRVPEADQVKQLGQTLDQMDEMGSMLTKMQVAWNKGDTEGLTAIMNEGVSEMPGFYKMIFTDRNATWAEWIDKRMDQPGTVFMAVGAGHLAGKDSVQAMLKAKGMNATRVQ